MKSQQASEKRIHEKDPAWPFSKTLINNRRKDNWENITCHYPEDSGRRGKIAIATVVLIMFACLMGPSKQMKSLRRRSQG